MKRTLLFPIYIYIISASFVGVAVSDNIQLLEKTDKVPAPESSIATDMPSLARAEDLNKILFVAVYPYGDFIKNRDKWPQVFKAYHIQWLNRCTGFNDAGFNDEDRLDFETILSAHNCNIITATEFTMNPLEINQDFGFRVKYYKKLLPENRWCTPAGSQCNDPYEAAGNRDLSGVQLYAEGTERMAMSISSPYWLKYQKDSIAYVLNRGIDAIEIDSAGQAGFFYGMRGDFSDWGVKAFGDYLCNQILQKRFSLPTDKNIDTLDIKAEFRQLLAANKNQDQLLSNPLIKEWVIFNYAALQNFHNSLNAYAKESGLKNGKKFVPYYGNLCIGHPNFPLGVANPSVLLSPCMDVIEVESLPAVPPLRLTTLHKLAMAMANYQKPVWSLHQPYYGFPYEPKLSLQQNRSYESLHQLYISECYATGVVPQIGLGGWPGVKSPFTLFVDKDGNPYPSLIPYFDFVFNHQDLFLDAKPYNKVALVYSVPTFTWNDLPLFQKYLGSYRTTFAGLGRLLDELHIPYDVIIFGQKELWDDSNTLSQLSKYKTIILPQIDCFSNKQLKALKDYTANQGRLFVAVSQAPVAKWNDMHLPRTNSVADWSVINKISADMVNEFYENSFTNMRNDETNRSKLQTLLKGQSQVKTNASYKVGINIFTKNNQMIIHFVNHDYVPEADSIPPKEPFNITVEIPNNTKPIAVHWLCPQSNTDSNILFHQDGHALSFQTLRLNVWAVAVIELQENMASETTEKINAEKN